MNPELTVFLTAMTPIGELRAAIPLALGVYKMSPLSAFFWSVLGNISVVVIILLLFKSVSDFLIAHSAFFKHFFDFLFARTRKKFNNIQGKWGALALIVFVAIPLPVTGGWSGALVAYLFGISFKRALLLISIGIVIAGILVTGASIGAIKLFF